MELQVEKLLGIKVYSHFFKVTNPTPRVISLIMRFCGRYVQVTQAREKDKNSKPMPYKVFAARIKDNSEFRFHIGQLKDFLTMLKMDHITEDLYSLEYEPMYEPYPTKFKLNDGWVLKDFQEEVKKFILADADEDNHSRMVCLPTGQGKAQSLDAFIQVPDGWKMMRDIQIDDEVVTKDGSVTKVTGVFPQGLRQMYSISFQDGRDVECDGDHLWRVFRHNGRPIWKVMTTRELNRLMTTSDIRCYIDLVDPYDAECTNLDEDPYELGCRLDQNKHNVSSTIPSTYLKASTKQRIALLNGIMDCGGNINVNGVISYLCKVHRLAIDIQYLVRSLGGIASITEAGDGDLYRIIIRTKNMANIFFKPKRRIRTNGHSKINKDLKLRVVSINKTTMKEAQCISIDHPDKLYVTDHFIVTHNTVTSLASVAELNHRTAIVILPAYIDKWGSDVTTTLNIKAKEIMMVRGSQQLKGIIDLAKEGQLTSKVIIISIRTIQNFYKSYELVQNGIFEEGYGCLPEDLFKVLQVGNIIIDEAHMHLYAVFKTLIYTHVPKVIGLSATLMSNDPFIRNVQHMMFPKEIRFDKIKMDQYIRVFSLAYQFRDFRAARIRTSEYGSNNYSHIAFEKSILKSRALTEGYLKLIEYLVNIGYVENFQPNDKLAIYASSIAMCDAILHYMKFKYPHYDIRRYVESDPYENVIDAQIRVSTILSSGTAIDIPDLRTVIMTTNISSPVANLQTLGRLRKLKDRDVKFYYIYCDQIRKQVQYHNEKKQLFDDRVSSIKEFTYSGSI